jgi:predicted kinase
VPRLIHINGPPAIGKSTIAERYTADHPGTLLLDIDRVRMLVGGWQQDFVGIGEVVRPLAMAMAQAHLSGGRDVVMPQYLGDLREIESFEHVATAAGAEFVEVVLMDGAESIVQRFAERGSSSADELLDVIASTVGSSGGPVYLRALHDELSDAVASRERAIVVQSTPGDSEGTYREVLAALADDRPRPAPSDTESTLQEPGRRTPC